MRTIIVLAAWTLFALVNFLIFRAVQDATTWHPRTHPSPTSAAIIHVAPEAPYHPWSLCTHSTSRPPTGPVRAGIFNGSNAGRTQCVVMTTTPSSARSTASYTVPARALSLTSEQEEV